MVIVGPIPENRPMLNPLTKTTPRLPFPQPTVVMNVSVGSVERLKVAFVNVGVMTVVGGAGELFQLVKLKITENFTNLYWHETYVWQPFYTFEPKQT